MKKFFLIIVFIFILIILFSPSEEKNNSKVDENDIIYSYEDVTNKGERLLGIDISTSKNDDYDESVILAKELGMDFTSLSLPWDEIELKKDYYENKFLPIANFYYPLNKLKVGLVLDTIDTTKKRFPKYLVSKKLDDPEVIKQFKKLVDYSLTELKDVELTSLSIGNEVDVYLGNDSKLWEEYTNFYKEIKKYINSKYPDLLVGVKMTYEGVTKNYIEESKKLNKYSDIIMLTYYPFTEESTVSEPSIVFNDFDKITKMYNKEIHFLELGYPSGTLVNSSEEKQAEFFHQSFLAWDKYKDSIRVLSFTWLHEISDDSLDFYGEYYGSNDEKFINFLGTLGIIDYDMKNKQSYHIIKNETKIRDW